MVRPVLTLLAVIAALLGFALGAGSDAQAGGVGHQHGPQPTVAADVAPVASGSGERTAHHGRSADHGPAAEPGAAGETPCGGGHREDGSMCCGVACHAAMPASADDAGRMPTVGPVRTPPSVDAKKDRLVLLIERPPRT